MRYLGRLLIGFLAGALGVALAGVGVFGIEKWGARQRAAQKKGRAMHPEYASSPYARRRR